MRWLRKTRGRRGVTLAELVTVLVIAAILAGILWVVYTRLMF